MLASSIHALEKLVCAMVGNVFLFILGLVALSAGLYTFRNSARLAKANADGNKAAFGSLGGRVGKASTAGLFRLLGAGATVMGAVTMTLSFFYRSS